MKDLQNRPYLTVEEAKAGIKIQVDGDFNCINKGETRFINSSHEGSLSFACGQGCHDLDGQLSADGTHYVGVYPAE